MKFSAVAAAALVAGVQAWPSNVTYTTEVVTAYTTYCPAPTQITHNGQTYTVTSATTLTITNCPCTISKPVLTTSYVACQTCVPASSAPTSAPVYPTVYPNSTTKASTTKPVVPTTGATVIPSTTSSTPIPTAGAGKAAALSGAGLAGVLGLVAYVL